MYKKDRLRRSMMFVPGNNPGMIRDAHIYGADSIMFDLEDSVAYTEKDAARFLVYNALKTLHFGTKETVVRINDLSSGLGIEDLEAVVRAGVQVHGVESVTKEQGEGRLDRVRRLMRENGGISNRIRIRSSVRVNDDQFTPGMFVRVHLPIPAECEQQARSASRRCIPRPASSHPRTRHSARSAGRRTWRKTTSSMWSTPMSTRRATTMFPR